MKKIIGLFLIPFSLSAYTPLLQPVQNPFAQQQIKTNIQSLYKLSQDTLRYLKKHEKDSWSAVKVGLVSPFGIRLTDIKKTLTFIMKVIEEDRGKKYQRMLDPYFLNRNFQIIKWNGDRDAAQKHAVSFPEGHIRITKYLIFKVNGSDKKTNKFCCALYAVPEEEKKYSQEFIEKNKKKFIRFKFTKQDVVKGALDHKKVKPLVWLTRNGLEEALMQGTIAVIMPNKKVGLFNVHKNNDIAYDRSLKDKKKQKRYWYFKETNGVLGYGDNDKIQIQPNVTFAGDVHTLGLGKLIAISYKNPLTQQKELRLGILADTGGAFEDNLYQLDFFTGTFPSRQAFNAAIKKLPESAEAYFLIKT